MNQSEQNKNTNRATAKLEALLFWFAEPVSKKRLMELLSVNKADLSSLIIELESELQGRGISIVDNGEEVTLTTSKNVSDILEAISKEELSRDISKASLDTLSIVLYVGPISRAEIDYIRGVSSQYTLRNLMIRGLIQKVDNPKDERKVLYIPTLELLAHMGVGKIEDLPDYEKIRSEISQIRNTQAEQNINQTENK